MVVGRRLGRVRRPRSPGKTWDAPAGPAAERRPARQPPRAGRPRRRAAADRLQHRRPAPPRGRVHPRADPAVLHPLGDARRAWSTTTSRSRPCADGAGAPPIRSLVAADPARGAGRRPPVHPDEAADVARMRDYRSRPAGKTYRLLRGDFHRHTEISHGRRLRRRARGHVALRDRRRRASTGWATTTTTTAAARNTPGGSSRRRPTCTTAPRFMTDVHLRAERRLSRTATAT